MLAYIGPERRRFHNLRRAIDESPDKHSKERMTRMVRGLEPDLLQNMDSLCGELYSISDSIPARTKPGKDNK